MSVYYSEKDRDAVLLNEMLDAKVYETLDIAEQYDRCEMVLPKLPYETTIAKMIHRVCTLHKRYLKMQKRKLSESEKQSTLDRRRALEIIDGLTDHGALMHAGGLFRLEKYKRAKDNVMHRKRKVLDRSCPVCKEFTSNDVDEIICHQLKMHDSIYPKSKVIRNWYNLGIPMQESQTEVEPPMTVYYEEQVKDPCYVPSGLLPQSTTENPQVLKMIEDFKIGLENQKEQMKQAFHFYCTTLKHRPYEYPYKSNRIVKKNYLENVPR